ELSRVVGLDEPLRLLPGGAGGLFYLLCCFGRNVLVIYSEAEAGVHYASQGQAGHSVQELARHGGVVLLYYPVCYLALEGSHRFGVYRPHLELAVLYHYVGIVLALLVLADV